MLVALDWLEVFLKSSIAVVKAIISFCCEEEIEAKSALIVVKFVTSEESELFSEIKLLTVVWREVFEFSNSSALFSFSFRLVIREFNSKISFSWSIVVLAKKVFFAVNAFISSDLIALISAFNSLSFVLFSSRITISLFNC